MDWGVVSNAPPPPPHHHLHFLKTIEDINMKLAPLIKRRETAHDVTMAPSWIFMVAILDFGSLSKRRQNIFIFRFKFVK